MSRAARIVCCVSMAFSVLIGVGGVRAATAGDGLEWGPKGSTLSAHLDAYPLPTLLRRIAAATGWQVFVEPGTTLEVTADFDRLDRVAALERLLRGTNYALLPKDGGPSMLFVFKSEVGNATERIVPTTAPGKSATGHALPNERIIVLKPGSKALDELVRRFGAKIAGQIDGMNAYRLIFPDERQARRAAAAMAGREDVESIETNMAVAAPATIEPLAQLGADVPLSLSPDISPSANKVIIGLLDTPVQDPSGRLSGFLQPGISVHGDYTPADGALAHGTAMAQTLLDGVARALSERGASSAQVPLSILPIDVYDQGELASTFAIARGLAEALNHHVNVINLSLGGDSDSTIVRQLLATAVKNGVLVFGAAGNEPVTSKEYPAADPGVISVTATNGSGGVASWANQGSWVDTVGPADNVLHFDDRAWQGTGTSFSTSWVSGWAAGTLANGRMGAASATQQTLMRWGMPSGK